MEAFRTILMAIFLTTAMTLLVTGPGAHGDQDLVCGSDWECESLHGED